MQAPCWVLVPNGSAEVLAIAIPVSKPAVLLTNGKSRFVEQALIVKPVLLVGTSAKRGIGAEVLCVITVLSGAKLPVTVAVPRPGLLAVVFAAYAMTTGTSMVSADRGFDVITS